MTPEEKAQRRAYRRELAATTCPCHSDPFASGPCEQCRARIEKNAQRIAATVKP